MKLLTKWYKNVFVKTAQRVPVDVYIYQTKTPYSIVFLRGLFSAVETSTIKLATGYISCLLYIFSSYNFKYISKSAFVLGCECVVGLHSWPHVITHRHNDLTVLLKLPLRQYSLFQQQPQWKVHNYSFHTLSLELWDIFFLLWQILGSWYLFCKWHTMPAVTEMEIQSYSRTLRICRPIILRSNRPTAPLISFRLHYSPLINDSGSCPW